jgi:hypothetical protein
MKAFLERLKCLDVSDDGGRFLPIMKPHAAVLATNT